MDQQTLLRLLMVKFKKRERDLLVTQISIVLSRVQAFLPQIQQANQQLLTKDTSDLNIENVNEDEGQYIEMVCFFFLLNKLNLLD